MTTAAKKTVGGPLLFGVDRGDRTDASEASGRYYWAIGLPDSREAAVYADRIEVTPSGALQAWTETRVSKWDSGGDIEEREPSEPQVLLALAPGAWVHFYGASCLDGAPVMVSFLREPGE